MENIKYLLCQPGPNTKSIYIFKDVIKMQLGEFHITQQGLEASQYLRFSQSTRTQELIDNWGEEKSIFNIPLDDNIYTTSQFIAAKLL